MLPLLKLPRPTRSTHPTRRIPPRLDNHLPTLVVFVLNYLPLDINLPTVRYRGSTELEPEVWCIRAMGRWHTRQTTLIPLMDRPVKCTSHVSSQSFVMFAFSAPGHEQVSHAT